MIEYAFDPDRSPADREESRLDRTELDMGRMLLLVQALSRMLVEKGVCTEDELVDLALRIDLEDGVQDGRVTPVTSRCERCGRAIPPNRAKCAFCKRSADEPKQEQSAQ